MFALILFYLKERVVYLTFDDGPTVGSKNCLEVCIVNDVPVSLFWVGSAYQRNYKNLNRYFKFKNDFFLICNHSFSHGYNDLKSFYSNPDFVIRDFILNSEILSIEHPICRMPGVNIWFTPKYKRFLSSYEICCNSMLENGFFINGWDIEWEFDKKNPQMLAYGHKQLEKRINKYLQRGYTAKNNQIVLLMHDWSFISEEACGELNNLIENLKRNGFIFKKLDKLWCNMP